MKHIIYLLCSVSVMLFPTGAMAQSAEMSSDEGRISINAVVPDGDIPSEACQNLETKLQRALVGNGLADNGYTERFVLTAKIDITSKDIVPSTPARISQKMEVTFMVGDVIENKIYETCTISLAGIGTNENKAFISAFSKINPQQPELQAMLERAKEKITAFYSSHYDEILQQASTLKGMQQYDEAIFRLVSVPNVCADCYQRCQNAAVTVYKEKINSEGTVLLNLAKNEWASQPNETGASRVASIINLINPQSSAYKGAKDLREEVSAKLQADEKKEWDFQMQQYKDNQKFKQSIVDACKAIGVAWGNGQPQSVTKTIVHGWW